MSCADDRPSASALLEEHRARIEQLRAEGLGRRRIAAVLSDELGYEVTDSLVRGAIDILDAEVAEKIDAAADGAELDPLRKYASKRQLDAIDAYLRCGSTAEAAEQIGVSPGRLRALLSEARVKASKHGFSPAHDMNRTAPAGFSVKGVSTYYDKDGSVRGQWVKTKQDEEHKYTQLLDALQEVLEPMRGAAEPTMPANRAAAEAVEDIADWLRDGLTVDEIKARLLGEGESWTPTVHDPADLLAVYPMGDPHLGMYAWAAETGDDFDLDIAERSLFAAADHLVGLAPPADQALVVNLGDFFHSDTTENRTARSGHALDVDTRWAKVLEVGIKVMRRIIDRALEKHARVRVINEIGNHDDHSALMLSLALSAYYEREPRVEVDTSPDRFHWYRFGRCLLGVTHGNGIKINDLPLIMAHDRPADWGETAHRYWYTGHVHSDRAIERGGVIVETFRTLAARDAYAHHAGYRSGRDMKCDVLHRQWGRVNRHVVGVEQLRGAM